MQSITEHKGWHEEITRFFENPSRESLRDLLKNHYGELNNYDFKKEWPVFPKVARLTLGLANSGGGCLIVGVEERDDKTFDPCGLTNLADKADIQKGIQKFIPPQLQYVVLDFSYRASEYPKLVDKSFQILLVENTPAYIPFVSRFSSGNDIRANAIYTRRGTSTEEANYEELQEMFNRRLETGYSSQGELDLDKHLAELRTLFRQVPRYINPFEQISVFPRNPEYPEEGMEAFVIRLIEAKKQIIQSIALRK